MELRIGSCHAFGGQHKALPHPAKRPAEVLLADGIAPRGVDKVHAGLQKGMHKLPCAVGIDPLQRNAAKPKARDLKAGLSQYSVFHCFSPFLKNALCLTCRYE